MARILVVGSDPADREVLAFIAELRGHTCATAGSLQEGVNLLQKGLFDLAVTELTLDGASPAEIVNLLKRVSPDMAVIALAEKGETAAPADDVLAVPCSPEELTRRIERVLGKLVGLRAKYKREKRHFTRYPVSLPCSIRDLLDSNRSRTLEARTVNLSRGGLYLVAPADWKVGATIECVIALSTKTLAGTPKALRTEGKIVRVNTQEEGGIGIGATIERFEIVDRNR